MGYLVDICRSAGRAALCWLCGLPRFFLHGSSMTRLLERFNLEDFQGSPLPSTAFQTEIRIRPFSAVWKINYCGFYCCGDRLAGFSCSCICCCCCCISCSSCSNCSGVLATLGCGLSPLLSGVGCGCCCGG